MGEEFSDAPSLRESPKYLREADFVEAMNTFYSTDEKPPLAHTIWTGDFMALCKHDIACPVCFDAHAMISRDVTPGRYRQTIGPCRRCAEEGWRLERRDTLRRWLRSLFSPGNRKDGSSPQNTEAQS